MSSTGINHETGQVLRDFDHVVQSIRVILTTPIGSRVMRREFGSEVFDLVAKPLTARVILAVYAAAVTAIARWEPRYSVTGCRLTRAGADGVITLEFDGVYFPRGHLGDFTPDTTNTRVVIPLRGELSR